MRALSLMPQPFDILLQIRDYLHRKNRARILQLAEGGKRTQIKRPIDRRDSHGLGNSQVNENDWILVRDVGHQSLVI